MSNLNDYLDKQFPAGYEERMDKARAYINRVYWPEDIEYELSRRYPESLRKCITEILACSKLEELVKAADKLHTLAADVREELAEERERDTRPMGPDTLEEEE